MTLRIVYAEPGRLAEMREIDGKLESLQALVGGYIEIVGRITVEGAEVDIIGDEEARLKWDFSEPDIEKQGVRPNRWILGQDVLGPVFMVQADEDGEFVSMTEARCGFCRWFLDYQCLPVQPHEVSEPGFAAVGFTEED